MAKSFLDGAGVSYIFTKIKEMLSGKADSTDLTSHTGDTTVHITEDERTAWNGKGEVALVTLGYDTSTGAYVASMTASEIYDAKSRGAAVIFSYFGMDLLYLYSTNPESAIFTSTGNTSSGPSIIMIQVDASGAIAQNETALASGDHTHDGYAPAYTYGTTDMTAGTSSLAEGKLYFVYE